MGSLRAALALGAGAHRLHPRRFRLRRLRRRARCTSGVGAWQWQPACWSAPSSLRPTSCFTWAPLLESGCCTSLQASFAWPLRSACALGLASWAMASAASQKTTMGERPRLSPCKATSTLPATAHHLLLQWGTASCWRSRWRLRCTRCSPHGLPARQPAAAAELAAHQDLTAASRHACGVQARCWQRPCLPAFCSFMPAGRCCEIKTGATRSGSSSRHRRWDASLDFMQQFGLGLRPRQGQHADIVFPAFPGFFSPCAFEACCILLQNAAAFWRLEHCTGVSQCANSRALSFVSCLQVCWRSGKVQLNSGIVERRHQNWGKAEMHFRLAKVGAGRQGGTSGWPRWRQGGREALWLGAVCACRLAWQRQCLGIGRAHSASGIGKSSAGVVRDIPHRSAVPHPPRNAVLHCCLCC